MPTGASLLCNLDATLAPTDYKLTLSFLTASQIIEEKSREAYYFWNMPPKFRMISKLLKDMYLKGR